MSKPFHHVGPTIAVKDGFAFQTFDPAEGIKTHSFERRSEAATQRGVMLRRYRDRGVEYLTYPDARSFGRTLRELRGGKR